MTRRLSAQALTCIALLALGGQDAWAQVDVGGQAADIGYRGLPATARGSPNGVNLSDDVILHFGIGAEAGYDSNVFYAATAVQSAPILRVLPFLELTNARRSGAIPAGLYFNLNASLQYREYLTEDPAIKEQRAFMPTLAGFLETNSGGTVSFGLGDTFTRTEDPPYIPNQPPFIRYNNQASLQLRFAPGGGRVQGLIRYTNSIDFFETESLRVANSMLNEVMVDASWRWLPKTALFVRVSQGIITFFNEGKNGSRPLRGVVGLRGLITEKLSATIAAGYVNGFYTGGESTSGVVGSISGNAELNYRPTVLTTLTLGYRRDFQNAIFGNFYYVNAVYAAIRQYVAGRLSLALTGRYERRNYEGLPASAMAPTGRDDNFAQVGATFDYNLRSWLYTGIGYGLIFNDSDFTFPAGPDGDGRVDYTKHQVFARLGITN